MGIEQRLSVECNCLLNQTQLQSLELLVLNNMELQSLLESEYLENPMLEYTGSKSAVMGEERFSDLRDIPVYDRQEAGVLIKEQLNMEIYTKAEQRVMNALILCLDSKGYFTESIDDIAKLLQVDTELVMSCLDHLKELEPAGIFASDLKECLLIQLHRLGICDEILENMITYHLEDISKGRIGTITRALGISSVQAKKYVEFIKKMEPVPLAGVGMQKSEYIVPDIICRKRDGKWEICMNDEWVGNYEINDYYVRMYQRAEDEELKLYFKKKLDKARFIINSIEQRRRTILKVTEQILDAQADYFEGKGGLKPLKMEDIASALGIHVSTVSRAIRNKYMEYSGGILAMKDVFVSGVGTGGDTKSVIQIKERIRNLVEEESKKVPLSDQRISEELKKDKIQLSRRGVAKYRQEMGIPSSMERQERD